MLKKFFLILIMVSAGLIAKAQDRYFARTYNTTVLSKGAIDLEFWHTSRIGHAGQYFHAQDQRMEIEIGLGKSWQTAFYFNRYQKRYSTGTDGTETSNEIGFSNEWKWKIKNQGRYGPAIALYGEWGVKGGDELEFETKVIIDRWIGKGLLAFNAVAEYEREFEWKNGKVFTGEWELPVEFDLAYMYFPNAKWGIGFEVRNHNEITKTEGWENSVFWGGPTINFIGDGWFIIANYLPQWGNVHKTSLSPYNKVLDKQERTEFRLLLGISLK
jgi:hypothetical protein